MTQLLINIEVTKILPSLRRVLGAIKGISITETKTKRKCGIDLALEDVKAGRVQSYDNTDDLFRALGI